LSSERNALGAIACVAIVFVGCELDEAIVTPVQSQLVVHAVLSPTAGSQTILLERSWDGINTIWKTGQTYSQSNPITGGSGFAEISAEIDVVTPSGNVLRATEARLVNPTMFGGGLYQLPLQGSALVPGGTYRLQVRTTTGEQISASTVVPRFTPTVPIETNTFDRVRDTVRLSWPPVAGAAAYQVMLDSPYGPSSFFTDTTSIQLLGTLRNVSAEGLPHVFIPGFTQAVTIAAVDSNYYGYFRSTNHSQIGTGLINRVEGGLGVFGASTPVIRKQIRVVAPFQQAVEGSYRYSGSAEDSARTLIIGLTVYVESRSARAGSPDAISGNYAARPGTGPPSQLNGSMLGSRLRDSVQLVFLSNQRVSDTLELFRGRVVGDTIIGSYRFRVGTWRFLKRN
jgi:hypothetical protein